MESSIAVFLMRQFACEQLPTYRVVSGQFVQLLEVLFVVCLRWCGAVCSSFSLVCSIDAQFGSHSRISDKHASDLHRCMDFVFV